MRIMQSGDQRGPIPPTPARAQRTSPQAPPRPDLSQGDIRLPELERKEAEEEAAKIKAAHKKELREENEETAAIEEAAAIEEQPAICIKDMVSATVYL